MAAALDKATRKVSSDDGGKGKVLEERLERAKRRAEGAKRSRNWQRDKDRGKDFNHEQ